MLSLTACNDYLDVEPSSQALTQAEVFGSASEVDKALNGVYNQISQSNTFGGNLYSTFQLNSDVDFSSKSAETAQGNLPCRFDTRADASNINSLWNALYKGVEVSNEFIDGLSSSDIYVKKMKTVIKDTEEEGSTVQTVQERDITDLTQKMGEAKVMRAMFYHELLSYWGDIPFTMKGTYTTDNFYPEVTSRQVVSDSLINDLKEAAEWMYSDQSSNISAPERISKEAAYAMIARLALQAGGYSLNHDAGDAKNYKMTRPANYQEYYKIAREYTKKIIDAGGHKLSKSFSQVFIDECNFITNTGDDPIFEIPFTQNYTGNWGYTQGPASSVDATDATNYSNSNWGSCGGSARVSRFYGFMFKEGDVRRDYTVGFWGYTNKGLPSINVTYTMYNNKWSKLWNSTGLGKSTSGNTGINFAYIRYADVLLMFAEAENELNGPTAEAIAAVEEVRKRAFPNGGYELAADQKDTKEHFLKAVLDERKFEFAGENMRWKDLVRNNLYSETLLYTFLAYYSAAQSQDGTALYMDLIEGHDGVSYEQVASQTDIYYVLTKNYTKSYFPNSSLYMLYVANPWTSMASPSATTADKYLVNNGIVDDNGNALEAVTAKSITGLENASTKIEWGDNQITWSSDGTMKNEILYSLYGFIREEKEDGLFRVVDNSGSSVVFNIDEQDMQGNISRLPAVRYILPYPQEAISRSNGAYTNYYGY